MGSFDLCLRAAFSPLAPGCRLLHRLRLCLLGGPLDPFRSLFGLAGKAKAAPQYRRRRKIAIDDDRFPYQEPDEDIAPDGPQYRSLGSRLKDKSLREGAGVLRRFGIASRDMDEQPDRSVTASDVEQAARLNAVPHADEVAVMLLLAKATEAHGGSDGAWRAVLQRHDWSATLLSPVEGFELRFVRMLKEGAFVRPIRFFNGYEMSVDLTALPPRYERGRASAVRPGLEPSDVLTTLQRLADAGGRGEGTGTGRSDEGGAWRSGRGTSGRGRAWRNGSSGKRGRHGGTISSGSDIIEPESQPALEPASSQIAATGPSTPAATLLATPPISVETLHGFGAAGDWALDLKLDLALWQAGDLPWSQMSTRLLLSGLPGTGKTTFARALCNTLQVPLVATSVSTWLEASYLGDVIKRMEIAFEEARGHAPAILFIDEIDGIGRRGGNREYGDYWTSVINKLLELIDGSSKTEGLIVVGATNRPEVIDAALRRSGRLEAHVQIPLPDVEALVGILAHHLGNDFPRVIASWPKPHETATGDVSRAQAAAPASRPESAVACSSTSSSSPPTSIRTDVESRRC